MWIKPGHVPDRPSPPEDTGERLVTFPRGDHQELRVTLAEFKGSPFVRLHF
jgi:hypothetical protein